MTAEAISSEPDVSGAGGFSTITISVPTADLDATLDQLAKLGKVHSRNASTDDVTAQYVDTEARVKTMQASVDRVRALMSQATKLGDVVALEAELSRRQADLEATQSQLAALKDSVALSPVEVRLSTDEQVLQQADDSTGFLAGLKAGWGAFTGSVTVLLTALGAVLPFAVVAALVLVPLLVWLRRRVTRAPPWRRPRRTGTAGGLSGSGRLSRCSDPVEEEPEERLRLLHRRQVGRRRGGRPGAPLAGPPRGRPAARCTMSRS